MRLLPGCPRSLQRCPSARTLIGHHVRPGRSRSWVRSTAGGVDAGGRGIHRLRRSSPTTAPSSWCAAWWTSSSSPRIAARGNRRRARLEDVQDRPCSPSSCARPGLRCREWSCSRLDLAMRIVEALTSRSTPANRSSCRWSGLVDHDIFLVRRAEAGEDLRPQHVLLQAAVSVRRRKSCWRAI